MGGDGELSLRQKKRSKKLIPQGPVSQKEGFI